jgi:hypothetical protein
MAGALHAVETATGQEFLNRKGAPEDEVRAAARQALKWWRERTN